MRIIWSLAVAAAFTLSACGGGGNGSQSQLEGGDNPQSFQSLALFDPIPITTGDSASVPFPIDGFFSGFKDPTLNIPNPSNAPFVTAANLQDGFSTTASLFLDMLGFVNFDSLAGNLLVIDTSTGQVLVQGTDYLLQPSPAKDTAGVPISSSRTRVLIEPLKPLKASTTYLVTLKHGPVNNQGQNVIASAQFRVLRSGTPVSEQNEPILQSYSAEKKAALENLRKQLVRPTVEAVTQITGVSESDQLLTWSFTTQSINKTLTRLAANATAGLLSVQNTGRNTGILGAPPVADIYSGILSVPYYLETNRDSDGNLTPGTATKPLSTFWAANPATPDLSARFLGKVPCGAFASGATLPDGQTATPSDSTTICFPDPVVRTTPNIPLLVTLPNSSSGKTKPANGWPVVIFQHGITRNRSDMLAVAPALAAAGFAVVAIDLPLHGIGPGDPAVDPTVALRQAGRERTFDMDLVNNSTGAPGADSNVDASGTHFVNLSSLITSRDNIRQAVADLIRLNKTLQATSEIDGNPGADLDGSNIRFVGHSLGGIVGTTFLGVNTNVGAGSIVVSGGGIGKLLDASLSFGPRIRAGLAASGINEGTDTYESYIRFAQTLLDSGDAINYALAAKANHPLHFIEVLGDQTVPNRAAAGPASTSQDVVTITGYLSGTEPLLTLLNVDRKPTITPPVASQSQTLGAKLNIATIFATGNHGSILDPRGSQSNFDTTVEMQRQVANFLASNGTCLPIGGNCVAPPAPSRAE